MSHLVSVVHDMAEWVITVNNPWRAPIPPVDTPYDIPNVIDGIVLSETRNEENL